MALRQAIQQTEEFAETAGLDEMPVDMDISEPRRVQTTREAVSPIISLERGDVQFWLQVIQVFLLYLILREIGRQ